jgi:hypothetical protein
MTSPAGTTTQNGRLFIFSFRPPNHELDLSGSVPRRPGFAVKSTMKLKSLIILESLCFLAVASLAFPRIAEGLAGATVDVDLYVPNLANERRDARVTLVANGHFGHHPLMIRDGLVVAARPPLFTIRVTAEEAQRLGVSVHGPKVGYGLLATIRSHSWFERVWDWLESLCRPVPPIERALTNPEFLEAGDSLEGEHWRMITPSLPPHQHGVFPFRLQSDCGGSGRFQSRSLC